MAELAQQKFKEASNEKKKEMFRNMMGGLRGLFPNLVNDDMLEAMDTAGDLAFRDEKPSDEEWEAGKAKIRKAQEHVREYEKQNYVRGLMHPTNKDYIFFVMKRGGGAVNNFWVKNCVLEKAHTNTADESDVKYYIELVMDGWTEISFDEVRKHLTLYEILGKLDGTFGKLRECVCWECVRGECSCTREKYSH